MPVEPDIHANAKFWLQVVDAILKFVALLVGAAWTWMNYRRGRTYRRKLELGATGTLFKKNNTLFLSVACHLKNVGQSNYPIQQVGTSCEVSTYRGPKPDLVRTYNVFEDHGWIEPGEQIDDPILMLVPFDESELVALHIRLRVLSGDIVWNSSCIVEVPDGKFAAAGKTEP